MSNSRCNRCSFDYYIKRAEERGRRIATRPGHGGGVEIYEHDKDRAPNLDPDGPDFIAWFMELPAGCAC